MNPLRFDGRVAVVTGAGRGIGRAHAHLLASRGAHVVVNDLGGSMEGEGSDAGPAEAVVDEISSAGGTAVADTHDISTTEGGEAVVRTALDSFGGIDILINNAGIVRWAGLPDVDLDNLEAHLAVHLRGSFNTMRAAWPHFVERQYGRVVHTTSSGLFGLENNLGYAAAKAGTVGMTRSAKLAGAKHGILVNCVAPAAMTRMAGGDPLGDRGPQRSEEGAMSSAAVSPMVAYLAHEECRASGEVYTAGGGRFGRLFIASTTGYLHGTDTLPTIEDVASHLDQIEDESGYDVPADLMAWSGTFLRHQFGGAGAS